MAKRPQNHLYYGDNLDILRRYIDDESVDLIYLDPPFNSNADYNVLFAEKSGDKARAQIKAFGDTWQWGTEAAAEYAEVMHSGHDRVAKALKGMHDFLGGSDMLAYLSMMAIRLIELRRVLKPIGSLYLHCDPTASHYLKIIIDSVFGPERFRNEIIWRRADPKGHAFTRFPSTHDVILYSTRSAETTWTPQYREYDESYLKSHYSSVEPETGRQFTLSDCTNPNHNRPNLTYEWQGVTKVWRWTRDKMQAMHDAGRLVYTKSGAPRYKRYLDEMSGTPVTTIWDDIPFVNSQAQERLGYPTQKPTALLERIVNASSNPGDVVLDPFCGCGTTIAAAQKLGRRWIGIDITHLAITLIKSRLHDSFGPSIKDAYEVIGEPVDLASAHQLASEDKFQFQVWTLGLVGARPLEVKKGADKGIDGRLYFNDSADDSEMKEALISVKGGHVTVNQVRDLRGVIERDKAALGVFLCIERPTGPMKREAAEAGFYTSPAGSKHPRLQLLTVEELLDGKQLDLPKWHAPGTFKRAPKAARKSDTKAKRLSFDD